MSTRKSRAANGRAVWPTETMVQIEQEIGRPVIDWLAEHIVEMGSVKSACEKLASMTTAPHADWPVRPETIREWWNIACRKDPGLSQRTQQAKRDRRAAERQCQKELAAERQREQDALEQIRNGQEGKHCCVCGAPLPARRETTCEPRCAELWIHVRYNIDQSERDRQQLANALWNIEHTDDDVVLRWARKVAAGQETKVHGRWLLSESIKDKLEEVLTRREHAKNQWGDLAATMPPIPALERGIARRSA
jgi:predicted nucleic acid-binding Zn ribbon protein